MTNDDDSNGQAVPAEAAPSLSDRERAIALLEANHAFPTDYTVSVIAINSDEVTNQIVTAACAELTEPLPPEAHEIRHSAQGKYVSHRLSIRCADAEYVLRLYARLRTVEGIKTVL